MEYISKCQGCGDLPEDIAVTCTVAESLFDERFPIGARFQLLAEQPSSAKIARDWDPVGKMGIAGCMMMDHPSAATLFKNFGTFVEVSRVFLAESILPPNPVLQSALTYLQQITPLFAANDEGFMRLLQAAWCARFSEEPDLGQHPFQPAQELRDNANTALLFKSTKDLLAGLPKATSTPSWFTEWRDHMKKLREEREQGKLDDKGRGCELAIKPTEGAAGQEAEQLAGAQLPTTPPEAAVVAEDEGAQGAAAQASGSACAQPAELPVDAGSSEPKLKEGDIGITSATKKKEMYDRKRCEVLAVLTAQYKVVLKEGPAAGETRKYRFDLVHPAGPAPGPADGTTEPTEPSPNGGTPGGGANADAWKGLEDLFDVEG